MRNHTAKSTRWLTLFSRGVIVKLLGFTFAMAALPIGSYFATVHTVFKGINLALH